MEENKSIKVSLGTVVCLFIIFILIIALGGMYYYYNYVKITDDDIQQGNTIESDNNISIETDDRLDEKTAKTIIQNYLNLQGRKEGSYVGFLESLELVDKLETDYNQSITVDGTKLYKTNIKYNDYKNKMLTYMSENRFKTSYSEKFVESNGYLYFEGDIGASGYSFDVVEANLEKQNNGEYVYLAKCNSFEGDVTFVEYVRATIIKENGIYVLDNYEYVQSN